MQSVWTRATQLACSCRCPACLRSKPAAVRRIATAAGNVATRSFSTGTLLYSAIFAAACVVDGETKAQRRKQWDNAIVKAKQEVEVIENNTQQRVRYVLNSLPGATVELQREIDSIQLTSEDVYKYGSGIGAKRPYLPISTAPSPHPEHLPPQSLWSGDGRRERASKEYLSEKKLRLTELAVARLVLNMLLAIDLDGKSKTELDILPDSIRSFASLSRADQRTASATIKSEIKKLAAMLRTWERGPDLDLSIPTPFYMLATKRAYERAQVALTMAIKSHFDNHQKGRISFPTLVVRICHDFLTSPAPPSLQAYNLLLVGFLEAHQNIARYQIIDALVDLQREARYRPNEFTCCAILRSYRKRNLPQAFARFVSLMRAQDGDALMLANGNVNITPASRGRLVRLPHNPRKVLQAINPNALLFREMILGVLKFTGFHAAIEIVRNLKAEAWGLDWQCLRMLMRDCVMRRDWEGGVMIWEQMCELREKTGECMPGKIQAVMLALCQVCEQVERFKKLFRIAVGEGHDPQKLLQLVLRVFEEVEAVSIDDKDNVSLRPNAPVDASMVQDIHVQWEPADQNSVDVPDDGVEPPSANKAEFELAGSVSNDAGTIHTSPIFEQKSQHAVASG